MATTITGMTLDSTASDTKDMIDVLGEAMHIGPGPITAALGSINGGKLTLEAAIGELARKMRGPVPTPMPSDIYAAMRLSEYFVETEGDLAQTIYAPAEIGINTLLVSCPDKGVEREAKELVYDILFLEDVLREMYICSQVYGQAYPLEEWRGGDLLGIHFLNPTSVWTTREVLVGVDDNVAQSLSGWEDTIIDEIHPTGDWNERGYGRVWRVNPSRIQPYYHHKFDWQYYAIPPLRPTFRTISTRQVLDELVRATMEGFINQLWVFKLGTNDHPATPAHIAQFKNIIAGALNHRTGALVWDFGLTVERHSPNALDPLLANQKYMELTAQMMAQRGISLRLISGTTINGDATNIEMDVQILVERLKVVRSRLVRWANYLLEKVRLARGWPQRPTLRFANIPMEDQLRIRLKVIPMYQAGPLSAKTALTEAGYDYDEEMANKLQEDKSLLFPPTTYVQAVVGREGDAKISTGKPGRPDGAIDGEPREVLEAAYSEESPWRELIPTWWKRMANGEITPAEFISWMKRMNRIYTAEAYLRGYAYAGGGSIVNDDMLKKAVSFNEAYLDGFQEDIENRNVSYADGEQRAMLYNDHGRRISFMYGVFQAMREHGARYWRRVLHPELSVSGPCEACIQDARIVHSIEEPFFDHPHGVCSRQEVAFFADEQGEIPIVIPIAHKRKEGSERDMFYIEVPADMQLLIYNPWE